MDNTTFMVTIIGPICLVMSLSTLLYVKVWQKVIDGWLKNHYYLLPIIYMELIFGVLIIRFHNIWIWDLKTLLITIIGWDMIIESALYFLLPGGFIKGILKIGKNTGVIVIGGLIGLAIGGYLCYVAYYDIIVTTFQQLLK